jgi:aspartate/methionine/tyrosine aminotransferase
MKPSARVNRILQNKERLKSQGKVLKAGVISLDKGDPDFPTPAHICDAAYAAMRQGYTHYVPGAGDRDLMDAVCDVLKADYGCNYEPAGIIITNGAMEGLYIACAAFLEPGDEVIVFTPGYNYASQLLMVGALPVWVSLTPNNTLDCDALEAAVTSKTKAILYCNPNNPTGNALTRPEVEFLAKVALDYDLLLFADEVYKKLYYDGNSHFSAGSIDEIRNRTIMIDSFSKSYAMTGWRVGYVATTPELAQPMYLVHRASVMTINTIAQKAALAALRGPQDCLFEMVAEYDRRRRSILKKLENLAGFDCTTPNSAFYVYGRFDARMKSAEMVDYLYEKKVAVRSGTEFGSSGEGFIRLTYALPYTQAIEGIERMMAAIRDLN